MKTVICLTILCSAIGYVKVQITPATLVGELPLPIANDILAILAGTLTTLLGNCTNSNQVITEYWLFTRANSDNPIVVNSSDQVNGSKPIIVINHGWMNDPNSESLKIIKDAYLQRFDCNVICLNYSMYAMQDYQTAYCHIPAIGVDEAHFLCNLTAALNINISDVHVVGFSLGAHVAGIAGNNTKAICGEMGRISGLDPAGPLFQGISLDRRLDKTDAKLVDVSHTNQGRFGYTGNCGDADFYPNCGYLQPGCTDINVIGNSTVGDISNSTVLDVGCSHSRSTRLFAESINNNSFYAVSCLLCGLPICFPNYLGPTHTYMGESCRSQPANTEYTLKTNAAHPYGQGPVGPLN